MMKNAIQSQTQTQKWIRNRFWNSFFLLLCKVMRIEQLFKWSDELRKVSLNLQENIDSTIGKKQRNSLARKSL